MLTTLTAEVRTFTRAINLKQEWLLTRVTIWATADAFWVPHERNLTYWAFRTELSYFFAFACIRVELLIDFTLSFAVTGAIVFVKSE